MVKILSQAGISLADMYQAEGSIAGIEELDTRELGIIHEMGATIFSERFRTTFRRVGIIDVLQSTDIDLSIVNMPEGISRIIGVQVFSLNGARIANCQVSLHDPVALQDFPIWAFDLTIRDQIRIQDAGAAVANTELLNPVPGLLLPSFVTVGQTKSGREMSDIHVRARTTAFGAGTATLTVLVHFAFNFTSGVSAFGARIPSW